MLDNSPKAIKIEQARPFFVRRESVSGISRPEAESELLCAC